MKIVQIVLLSIVLMFAGFRSWSQTNVVPDNVEFAVLKNIYDSLSGSGWTTKTNWPVPGSWPTSATAAQFGTWFGISVSNGDIQSITLPSNNLVGVLPRSIGQLTRLKFLYLGTNQISGTIPSYTGLSQLQHLYLSSNLLTGSIPATIGSLTGLTKLKLDNNGLSGSIPSELGNLPALTDLFLNNNQLTGSVPSSLGSLSNLVYLYLRNNQLTGSLPSSLGSLAALQYFFTSNNQLSGTIPATFAGLSQLLVFDVSTNQLSGSLPNISGWTAVTQINVNSNQLSGAVPSGINACTALTILRADLNAFTSLPASLLSLPAIVTINLENNEVNSIPDFSTQVNKANLTLQLRNNRLDFGQLEMIVGKGIKTVTYNPQKLLNDVTRLNVPIGGTLVFAARARGQNGTTTWHFRPDDHTAWGDVTSYSEDATKQTFTKSNLQLTDKGQIKYKLTNSVVTGFTLESVPATLNVGYDVAWTDLTGVTSASDNTITKTAANGWGTGGAASVNQLPANTDGWIEFTYDNSACEAIFGFSDTNTDANINSIDYGIMVEGATHSIRQNGTSVGSFALAQGDVLRIERAGSSMKFYKNGWLEQTVTNVNTGVLIGDAAINGTGCKIYNARASFWIPAAQGQIPDIWETLAMKNIYDSLGGPSWTHKTNWPAGGSWAESYTAAQMDTWYGITISGGDIIRIEVQSNNLTGKIPKSISKLDKLQLIRFQSNHISGSIPKEILQLTSLAHLNLSLNELTGPIPENIGNLTALTYLSLYSNGITGTLPASLFMLPNLETLYIMQTDITGPIPTQISLPKIKILYLYQNNLTGPIPAAIGNLQATITALALENNPSMGGPIPSEIGNLTKLTELWLNGNGHTGTIPSSLGNLTQLKILNIFGNQLEGPIPSTFKKLVNLEWTALSENRLTGSIPAFFGKMTKMDSLWLNDNQLTGTIPDSLQYATSLALLSVSRNQLSGNLPGWLGNLSLMKTIQAAGNSFTGKIPAQWQKLNNLKILELSFTSLSDSIPEWLVSKTKLRTLYVNDSRFTYFPDFSTRSDKNLLRIKIENNEIPVENIEGNFSAANTHPFSEFTYGPQRDTKLVSSIQIQKNDRLQIETPSGGTHGVYQWEHLVGGTWANAQSDNQSTDPKVFLVNPVSMNTAGTYRYTVTNTWLNDILFESGPIEVQVTDPVQSAVDLLAFLYRYDGRNRLVRKKIPGADWIYMVYDNRDRLVMTQDGNQRSKQVKEWTFTKYDALNRPILTGIYKDLENKDLAGMQQKVNDFYVAAESNANEWYEVPGTDVHGYTNQSFPQVANANDYLTVTYYDGYSFLTMVPEASSFDYDNNELDGTTGEKAQEAQALPAVQGHVAGTKTKNLTDNTWLWTVHYYDDKYRVVQHISHNHKSGLDKNTNVYDFTGNVLRTKTAHSTGTASLSITRKFEYDHAGRLERTSHKLDEYPWVMLSENKYNALGERITQKLHSDDNGNTFRQHIDYRYNIRGWLSRINYADLAPDDVEEPEDFFGMEFAYNESPGLDNTPQYNGNISAVKWNSEIIGKQNLYNYSYDPLSRLMGAAYKATLNGTDWGVDQNRFDASTEYDLNGNILHMKRLNGKIQSMDDLEYHYTGNRLDYIDEAGDGNNGFVEGNFYYDDYAYDLNGNVLKDLNKGILQSSYNYFNLAEEITAENGDHIKFIYDANGTKLGQEVYDSDNQLKERSDYIGSLVYVDNTLRSMNHAEGQIIFDSNGSPEYQYNINDNVGNTRIVFTTKEDVDTYAAIFEDSTAEKEVSDFKNYSVVTNDLFDHTDAGTVYQNSQRLIGTQNSAIGIAKSFEVMAGDSITIEAYAKYLVSGGTSSGITDLAAALINAFGIPSAGVSEVGSYNAFQGVFSEGPVILNTGAYQWESDEAPKAYVNILVFNKNYQLIDLAFDQVGESAEQPFGDPVKYPHDRLYAGVRIKEPGYVYVYLSNENPEPVEVYFDDIAVSHKHSDVIQRDDYYPFGLSIAETAFQKRNPFYKGSSYSNFFGYKDLGFRRYDPSSGRFFNVDPLAELQFDETPYQYAGNNPVRYDDAWGLERIVRSSEKRDKVKRIAISIKRIIRKVVNFITGKRDSGSERAGNIDPVNKAKSRRKKGGKKGGDEGSGTSTGGSTQSSQNNDNSNTDDGSFDNGKIWRIGKVYRRMDEKDSNPATETSRASLETSSQHGSDEMEDQDKSTSNDPLVKKLSDLYKKPDAKLEEVIIEVVKQGGPVLAVELEKLNEKVSARVEPDQHGLDGNVAELERKYGHNPNRPDQLLILLEGIKQSNENGQSSRDITLLAESFSDSKNYPKRVLLSNGRLTINGESVDVEVNFKDNTITNANDHMILNPKGKIARHNLPDIPSLNGKIYIKRQSFGREGIFYEYEFSEAGHDENILLVLTVPKEKAKVIEEYLGIERSVDNLLKQILPEDASDQDRDKYQDILEQAKTEEGLMSSMTTAHWVTDQNYTYNGNMYPSSEMVLDSKGNEVSVKDVGTRPLQCWDATAQMVENAGFTSGGYQNAYQLSMEHKTENKLIYDTEAVKKGILSILSHLDEGRPVQVGVNYHWKHNINKDKSTDHWITLSGMKYDEQRNEYYFEYYEPGTNESNRDTKGVSPDNRIYIVEKDGSYILEGTKSVPGGGAGLVNYEVTCIRPNGDYSDKSGTINQEADLEVGDCETIKCVD